VKGSLDHNVRVIDVWVGRAGSWWFGVASHEKRLVATAIGTDGKGALRSILASIPEGCPHRLDGDSEFAGGVAAILARIEEGIRTAVGFTLCPDCVPAWRAAVLDAAACIPRGYVTTYGRIAKAAHTDARVVGRVMATNPLYPIVPCHRVVGADLSLVGYMGRQDPAALRAKLDRLRAEALGFTGEKALDGAGGFVVTPVEWVIRKAAHDGDDSHSQLSLW
jgi:O-6-methylguanine DNA methyltransferase